MRCGDGDMCGRGRGVGLGLGLVTAQHNWDHQVIVGMSRIPCVRLAG